MCEPVSITMAFMAVAGAVAAKMESDQQADAATTAANYAADADQQTLQAQQGEIYDKARMDRLDRQRQGMKERAKLRVAGGDGNIAARQQSASFYDQGRDLNRVDTNTNNSIRQNFRSATSVEASRAGRIATAEAGRQSAATMGINAASGAISGYSSGQSIDAAIKAPKKSGAVIPK